MAHKYTPSVVILFDCLKNSKKVVLANMPLVDRFTIDRKLTHIPNILVYFLTVLYLY